MKKQMEQPKPDKKAHSGFVVGHRIQRIAFPLHRGEVYAIKEDGVTQIFCDSGYLLEIKPEEYDLFEYVIFPRGSYVTKANDKTGAIQKVLEEIGEVRILSSLSTNTWNKSGWDKTPGSILYSVLEMIKDDYYAEEDPTIINAALNPPKKKETKYSQWWKTPDANRKKKISDCITCGSNNVFRVTDHEGTYLKCSDCEEKWIDGDAESAEKDQATLAALSKPFTPTKGEAYWTLDDFGLPAKADWSGDETDKTRLEKGLVFRSEYQAEKESEKS